MQRTGEPFESRMKKLQLIRVLSLNQLANKTGYNSKYLNKIEK